MIPLVCDCDHIDFVTRLRQTRVVDHLGELKCKFENGTHVTLTQLTEMNQYLNDRCGNLICNCDHEAFDAWIHDTHLKFKKRDFTCKYPNGTKVNLKANPKLLGTIEQKCIAAAVLAACVTGFVFLNLALSFAAYVWHSRWRLRYLLIMGRRNINPYHPLEECHIDLKYDVYISYERDSELADNTTLHEFVTRKIYPELQRHGFKVLIRDEFEPGMGLYNVISQALRRCKKLIALISKDHCRDFLNVFEFNTAVLEGIHTKRQVIVPIAVDRIGRRDLQADVYAFLSARPVPYSTTNLSDAAFIEFLYNGITS